MKLCKDIVEWYLPLEHEKELLEYVCERLPSQMDTFIDIGANIGTWTLNLHNRFKKVIAFEPFPKAYNVLCQNLELNHITNVFPVAKAVSDSYLHTELTHFATNGHSTLLSHHPIGTNVGEREGIIQVETITLDDAFLLREGIYKIDLIKIDTEGSEAPIIRGGLDIIKQHNPRLVIEIHDVSHINIIKAMLPSWIFEEYEWNGQTYLLSLY
jgi:FkbM family methyltransferase